MEGQNKQPTPQSEAPQSPASTPDPVIFRSSDIASSTVAGTANLFPDATSSQHTPTSKLKTFFKKPRNLIIFSIILALIICLAIFIPIFLLNSTPESVEPTSVDESSSIPETIEKTNAAIEKTSDAIFSSEEQDQKLTDLTNEYTETLSKESSTAEDKAIAAEQLSMLYNYQENYQGSISILEETLSIDDLTDAQRVNLLAQLESTYELSGNRESQLEAIRQILALPDDLDLSDYNTDIATVKENYEFILKELEND